MPPDVIKQIGNILDQRSVAVTRVGDKSHGLGNLLLQSFIDMGFKGELYPVGPHEDRVMGLSDDW